MDDERKELHFPDEYGAETTLTETARSIAHELEKIVHPELENLSRAVLELSAAMLPVVETIRDATLSVTKVITDFQIPTITKERKQELIASYKKWGEYGWTLYPDIPFDSFDEFPENLKAANATMMSFCSKYEINRLFEKLREQRIKKEDLEAAILCYDNRQYKACALILFGIIDAKLIRKQKRDKEWRPAGHSAVKKLRERFENANNEKVLFRMLLFVNLFTCLETLFASGGNFKSEPPTINRNFVSHGMTRRPVRQRDCIQLFLVLYNLMQFFEFAS